MRNWIIGAAAMLAVAVPGIASAQTGYVGVGFGNVDAGAGDEDFYGVEGAVAFAGSGSIVFEVDAAIVDSDNTEEGYGLTGHVYSRSDAGLIGGFVGLADSDAADTTWTVGLEASKFYTNWTLAGALYYANNDDADTDEYGIVVQPRVFIHDNFRLQGELGWASIDSGAGDDDAFQYGVGAEYQFSAIPISIGASYNVTDFDGGDVDVLSAVVRYNFGGTLRDRDRNGASQAGLTGTGLL